MILINEIISSNYMIGEVYGFHDVMDHPSDNKIRALMKLCKISTLGSGKEDGFP